MANNLTVSAPNSTKLTYSVLLESLENDSYLATVLTWPQCQAVGSSREEAIANLRELITARLQKAEIVSLEIDIPKPEHPWMKFAGMFKDDPDFDEVMAFIEEDRRQLDAEMEAYYRELETEEIAK